MAYRNKEAYELIHSVCQKIKLSMKDCSTNMTGMNVTMLDDVNVFCQLCEWTFQKLEILTLLIVMILLCKQHEKHTNNHG